MAIAEDGYGKRRIAARNRVYGIALDSAHEGASPTRRADARENHVLKKNRTAGDGTGDGKGNGHGPLA